MTFVSQLCIVEKTLTNLIMVHCISYISVTYNSGYMFTF